MASGVRVDRSPEQKLKIVLEGLKSGIIAETCRRYQIAANLFYRWKKDSCLHRRRPQIILHQIPVSSPQPALVP